VEESFIDKFQLFLRAWLFLFSLSLSTPSVRHEGHRPCSAWNNRTAVHYAYEDQAEVRLWRDLIEFWVYGVWFAELLIKHPRRGAPTHERASHTPVLRYHRNRRLFFSLSSFRIHLSLSCPARVDSPLTTAYPHCSSSLADWYLSPEFNPPAVPLPPSSLSTFIHVLRGR